MDLGSLVQTVFPKGIDRKDTYTPVTSNSSNVKITESDWYDYTVKSGFDFDTVAKGQSRFFKSDNFNTELSKDVKSSDSYKSWAAKNITDPGYDYDYNAAFVANSAREGDSRGHLSDIGKKPNHPTFSVGSKHATGKYKAIAGTFSEDGKYYIPSKKTLAAVNKWRIQNGKDVLYGTVR